MMARPTPTVPPDWPSIVWPTFDQPCHVLAVDQSLVNSGWVLSILGSGQPPALLDCDTIHSRPSQLSGFADSFFRGEQLFGAYRALIMQTTPTIILHEMPAVQGRVATRNREAGTVAVMALRCAGSSLGYRSMGMMQAQHVKKMVTGTANALKPTVRSEVLKAMPDIKDRLNEHITDAIALTIAAALDGTIAAMLDNAMVELPPIGKVK